MSRRRQELLELLDRLNPMIDELSKAIEQEAERRPEMKLLMTHPGVGPITALAFVLVIGTPERFHCGRQIASYLGLIPCEESSAAAGGCELEGIVKEEIKYSSRPRAFSKLSRQL